MNISKMNLNEMEGLGQYYRSQGLDEVMKTNVMTMLTS